MKGKVDLVTSAVSKYQALRVRSFGVIRSVDDRVQQSSR